MRLIEAFVALIVGRRVPISWDDRASLDSQGTIHLPRPTTGDAAEIGLLTRLAVHEAGHVLHTEQGFADRLDPVELLIFNVLEDPRMERAQCSEFPGAGLVLSRGLDEMLQGLEKAWEAEQPQAGKALALDLLIRGFLQLAPHEEIVRRAPRMLELLAPGISPREREAIDATMAEIPTIVTSLDAENTARALVSRLRQEEVCTPPADSPEDQQEEQAGAENEEGASASAEQEHQASGEDAGDDSEAAGTDSAANDASPPPKGHNEQRTSPDASDAVPSEPQRDDGMGFDDRQGRDATQQPASGGAPEEIDGAQASADTGAVAGQTAADGPETPAAGPETQPDVKGVGGDRSGAGDSQEDPAAAQAEESDQEDGAGQARRLDQMEQLEPFDMGSLLRQTIAERYGAPAVDVESLIPDAAPITDDELERVRAAVMAADADGDLEQLLQISLQALAGDDVGDEQLEELAGIPGGASMALAGGEGGTEPVLLDMRLQGVQARLVSVLQREFQDRKRRPTKPANAGGRIIAQRHWRLGRLGDTRIFAKKRIANGIEAAATLLVDSSYSMKDRLQPALEVTLAFSLALQRLGVRTKVVRFPASDSILLETLQQFGESPRRCTERCRGISADGGTPIGAATAIETELLLQENRLKNFLAIVTDDDPGDPDTYLAALAQARDLDVQVVGVGIGCDISQWIPESVSITSVDQLPDALSALFRSNVVMKLAA
jgi:hypothetical protein